MHRSTLKVLSRGALGFGIAGVVIVALGGSMESGATHVTKEVDGHVDLHAPTAVDSWGRPLVRMVATQVNLYDEDMELITSIYDKDGVEFFLVNRQEIK